MGNIASPHAAGNCRSRLGQRDDGLSCIREDGHTGGCVYVSGSGSYVKDRHRDGGHG